MRFTFLILLFCFYHCPAQQNKNTLQPNRDALYQSIVGKTIRKNLSGSLSADTQYDWADAFNAMAMINYKSVFTDEKVSAAVKCMGLYSNDFAQALIDLLYSNFPSKYLPPLRTYMQKQQDPKLFAMAANCVLLSKLPADSLLVAKALAAMKKTFTENPILQRLSFDISKSSSTLQLLALRPFFKKDYLRGSTLLISFQNKNRNIPGFVIVRDSAGNFLRSRNDSLFFVPQLAKSISGMPSYISNGNTPQGIFRLYGFDTSKSLFIGPTTNIQLSMPFEGTSQHFFKDSSILVWDSVFYSKLLPAALQSYYPLYETYFAGKAGRTEIIAHGTTVDPEWYRGKSYYPLTPTAGCLCTKEIWSGDTGILKYSDQLKLTSAVQQAGGPFGYCIVVNAEKNGRPLTPADVQLLIK